MGQYLLSLAGCAPAHTIQHEKWMSWAMRRLLFAFLMLTTPISIAEAQTVQEVMDAAMRLKASKVQRTYDDCMKKSGNQDGTCKGYLEVIHKNEVKAMTTIASYFQNAAVNKQQLSKEFGSCTSPRYDYNSSIQCLEELATRLDDGAKGQGLFLK